MCTLITALDLHCEEAVTALLTSERKKKKKKSEKEFFSKKIWEELTAEVSERVLRKEELKKRDREKERADKEEDEDLWIDSRFI